MGLEKEEPSSSPIAFCDIFKNSKFSTTALFVSPASPNIKIVNFKKNQARS
jgi:hypothetical protein